MIRLLSPLFSIFVLSRALPFGVQVGQTARRGLSLGRREKDRRLSCSWPLFILAASPAMSEGYKSAISLATVLRDGSQP
ncbi:hypothetical protein B0T26DRAFT_697857 [Lasiosphaeria miniovina]|uniref:Secreted protein n=1 Tax=Lasiosphaeria miniovina TaxID=1954250 RepID=A0AA40B6F1_9PEZI|nr:uncharacterized protein B0T26DRAFT_697857 [Lasiosphaeria miniovina]KAK0728409.1 hypothetical protein B0T26DRAFT_697857 [Lasiosphaeria miniovina]